MSLNDEKKDFENRVKNVFIDENGMICLGWNKVFPTSKFGQDLMDKYPHIKKLYEEWEKEQIDKLSS